MRNPNWLRDEIILALDLYFSPDRGSIDDKNPKIIELSNILRALPLVYERPDEEKFRNPNGVTLKLSNFLAVDKDYDGKGMRRGSKLDKKVFKEFYDEREQLKKIATEIKQISNNTDIKQKIKKVEDDEEVVNNNVVEGEILYKLHKVIERDRKIVKKKKDQVLKRNGVLTCEACLFVFEQFYGSIGTGFIECHHRIPLSRLSVSTKTTLDDLALVCSNCHRMLHRKIDVLSIEDLKIMIKHQHSFIN